MGLAHDPTARDATLCPSTSKVQMTKSQAKSAAKRTAKRGHPGNIGAYECRACGKWHIGNERRGYRR